MNQCILTGNLGADPDIRYSQNGYPIATLSFAFRLSKDKTGWVKVVHDIRHTTASLLLSDGASPVYVKEQLGHTSIQMTVDIYGHLIPSSNRGAINRLDSRQSATQPQPAQKQMAQTYSLRHPTDIWCRSGESSPDISILLNSQHNQHSHFVVYNCCVPEYYSKICFVVQSKMK